MKRFVMRTCTVEGEGPTDIADFDTMEEALEAGERHAQHAGGEFSEFDNLPDEEVPGHVFGWAANDGAWDVWIADRAE